MLTDGPLSKQQLPFIIDEHLEFTNIESRADMKVKTNFQGRENRLTGLA